MEPIDALRTFRDSLYRCFDQRADALFELKAMPCLPLAWCPRRST